MYAYCFLLSIHNVAVSYVYIDSIVKLLYGAILFDRMMYETCMIWNHKIMYSIQPQRWYHAVEFCPGGGLSIYQVAFMLWFSQSDRSSMYTMHAYRTSLWLLTPSQTKNFIMDKLWWQEIIAAWHAIHQFCHLDHMSSYKISIHFSLIITLEPV